MTPSGARAAAEAWWNEQLGHLPNSLVDSLADAKHWLIKAHMVGADAVALAVQERDGFHALYMEYVERAQGLEFQVERQAEEIARSQAMRDEEMALRIQCQRRIMELDEEIARQRHIVDLHNIAVEAAVTAERRNHTPERGDNHLHSICQECIRALRAPTPPCA